MVQRLKPHVSALVIITSWFVIVVLIEGLIDALKILLVLLCVGLINWIVVKLFHYVSARSHH